MRNLDFPFIDLHRHLDGNIRLETILDLGIKHNLPLPSLDIEGLRPHVQVTTPQPGVMAFISKFKWMVGVLVDYDACRRVAYENVIDACNEGIDYIELRFSPWFMAEPFELDSLGVVEAIVEGVQQGREETGMLVNLIGIISRTYGTEIGWKELEVLLSQRDHLVGLDLAGDEVNFPAELFEGHFKKGRDAGWQITVHAGESDGPESVWQALEILGAVRIGHALSIEDDPKLRDYILKHKIGIEANLTSNLQTTSVPDLISHPLKSWLERGLLATINTDDPGISGIDLPHEFEVAAPAAGLSENLIYKAQKNSLEISFLAQSEKELLLSKYQ